jgi:beta-glucosidase
MSHRTLLCARARRRPPGVRTGAVALSCLLALLGPAASARQTGAPAAPQAPSSAKDVEKRVEELLRQMTLPEKVGQLNQIFLFAPQMYAGAEQRVRKGEIGSFLFVTDPAAINRLQRVAVEESRLKIPILFGFDVIHGLRTVFPVPLAMAASWDMALIEQAQSVAAREASAVGIKWTFAPMVDIARDARWGRIVEGAGEDPHLGAAVARAQVRGFQGKDVADPERVLACMKHFGGYGAAEGGRDYDATNIPDNQLFNVYLPPFKAAVDAGVGSVMTAYQDLNDVPATGNRFLLQDVLRRDWGFRGFVVSDAFSVRDLTTHGFARDGADAARRALTAGVNMDMGSDTYTSNLPALVEKGQVPVAAVDDAVRAILTAKFRLGLFERPYVDEARAKQLLGSAEHRKLARVAAQRSAVLLRNEGNLLPLAKNDPKITSIAVIGPCANTGPEMLGPWSLAGNPAEAVTVVQGIRDKVPANVKVECARGGEIRRRYPSMFEMFMPGPKPAPLTPEQQDAEVAAAVELAGRSDLVVMVLGELQHMSGELASRASVALPGRQQELLERVVATGKPVVIVLVNGRPLDISWAAERVPAILEAWHPGTEGGTAIADLLFGDATPGGKLPATFPRATGQVPIYYGRNLTQQPESAPTFGSRYLDIPTSPLYPFGYGLSYTTFAFSNLRVGRPEVRLGESVEVTVDVQNTGSRPGDEVVQLYVHQRAGSASRPVRELKGFERVALAPGEKRTVRFTLGKDELSFWSMAERRWVQEAETFDVWAGGDSNAPLSATLQVTQ